LVSRAGSTKQGRPDAIKQDDPTPIKKKSKNNEYDARENVETEEQSYDGFKISKERSIIESRHLLFTFLGL
jgi:hypothetical protein